jgi:predicted Zn finger-like uncharacterized protein
MAQPLKVSCPSCSSKFHIPLHLVRGKVVSFRCKKCKGTIPVDGRAISTATPQPLPAPQVMPPEGWVPQPSSPPPEEFAPHYSEPSARLSISDGLVVHEGMPSTTGLQVDTPAAFTHSHSPSQRPAVPGASRTPPWGLGPPTVASAPPPPISRTEPPEAFHKSDPPPSFRTQPSNKKVIGGAVLVAAAAFVIWGVSMRSPSGGATNASASTGERGPRAPATEPKAAAEPARPAVAAPVVTEPVKTATAVTALPTPKDPEPVAPAAAKPARVAKGRTAKAAPPVETQTEAAPAAEEAAAPAPLTGAAAAAQEATNSAAQEIDFNKAAARQALDEASQRAASCRTIDSPAGAARIAVTFAPSGNVTDAVIDSGPFVGTPAGACVASKFRSVHVPAFTGDPITVKKTISF